jgi:tetratricopeptide (TPR) repeat protein
MIRTSAQPDRVRAQLLATCLLNAGRPAEAERALGNGKADGSLGYYRALAFARQGKIDEAVITFLNIIGAEPQNEHVRCAASLLHRQAVRSINQGDTAAAASALGDALKLDPNNGALRSLLSRIENVVPVVHLKSNKRQDAVEAWEKAQREAPSNARVAHSLALACFFWAVSLEAGRRPVQADSVWRKAISNWVLTRYSDSFWEDWARDRNAVYPLAVGAIERLRATWGEHIGRSLQSAAASAGNAENAKRLSALESAWWIEDTAACAIAELQKVQCSGGGHITRASVTPGPAVCAMPGCGKPLRGYPAHDLVATGPIGQKQFGLEAKAAKLARDGAQLPNGKALSGGLERLNLPFLKSNTEVLKYCLSPSASAFALVARRRFDEALAMLQ